MDKKTVNFPIEKTFGEAKRYYYCYFQTAVNVLKQEYLQNLMFFRGPKAKRFLNKIFQKDPTALEFVKTKILRIARDHHNKANAICFRLLKCSYAELIEFAEPLPPEQLKKIRKKHRTSLSKADFKESYSPYY